MLLVQNYDPVVEYNKSIELFEMHYQPQPQNLFRIILQISRFFKEFADFESSSTPEFRHPSIRNRLLTIGSGRQKSDWENNSHENISKVANLKVQKNELNMNPFMDDDDSLIDIEDFHSVEVDLEILDHQEGRSVNFLEDIGLLKEIKKLSLYDNHNLDDILSGYEKSNVDIPTGYLTFREVFAKML